MKYKAVFLFIFCFVCGILCVSGQNKTSPISVKTVSLRQIQRYGERYTDKTLKISNVILEDVRGLENYWAHLFQLYDPRTKFRRGAEREECCFLEFSIFADEDIGKSLLEQKGDWLNKRVNVYVQITDRGLTPLTYIGYVVKVELLNGKGKVEKTLPKG